MTVFVLFAEKQQDFFKAESKTETGFCGRLQTLNYHIFGNNNQLCADFSKAFVNVLGAIANIIFSPLLIIKENKTLKLLKNMQLSSKQLLFNAFKRLVFDTSLNISKVKDQLFFTGCFLSNPHKEGRKANR